MRLAESCRPILTAEHVKRCISSGTKASLKPFYRSLSNAAIARLLQMTEEERLALPKWFKPARERKSIQLASRRLLIARALQLAGKWSSDRHAWIPARGMASLLAEKHGIKISHVTVLRDYGLLFQQHFSPAPFVSIGMTSPDLKTFGTLPGDAKKLSLVDRSPASRQTLRPKTGPCESGQGRCDSS